MNQHYFSAEPSGVGEPRTVRFSAYGREYELGSASNVFAADRLDLGTAVLFRYAPSPAAGRADGAAGPGHGTYLDLGCGYGPIGCVLATESPAATVWAVDVNQRALDLTRQNADRLGLSGRIRVASPEQVPDDVRFDLIWSNPPVRIGKAALRDLLETWLTRLTVSGEAWLVVGKNLGSDSLQRWLAESGWSADRAGSAKGFRVLRVTRR